MVNLFASSAVDCGFETQLDQTKDYKIFIYYFSAMHAALRKKSKDWLARNQEMCLSGADCCFSKLAPYKSN